MSPPRRGDRQTGPTATVAHYLGGVQQSSRLGFRAGVALGLDRGFVGLDSTLDSYKELYWHPRLFERSFLPKWLGDGCPNIRQKARDMVSELIEKHDFRLEPDIQNEIDRIYAKAEADLSNRQKIGFLEV